MATKPPPARLHLVTVRDVQAACLVRDYGSKPTVDALRDEAPDGKQSVLAWLHGLTPVDDAAGRCRPPDMYLELPHAGGKHWRCKHRFSG